MITLSALNLVLAIFGVFSVVFGIYLYFRNPQIMTDQEIIKIKAQLNDNITDLQKEIMEIKQTHLRNVESDVKKLNDSIAVLNIAVAKLTTIIDERIPKAEKHNPMIS